MKASITIVRSAAVAAVATVGLMVPAAGAGAAPYPGADAVEIAAIAGVAIGAGVVLVRRNRRAATV